jgi:hypothetical protein
VDQCIVSGVDTMPFILLGVAALLSVGGAQAAVTGRLAIHRVGDRYRGSARAWIGYLGGMLLVAAGALTAILSIVSAVQTWMS